MYKMGTMGKKRYLLILATLILVIISLLVFGNTQWNKYIYIFQAYVYPTYLDGYINPPANFSGTWVMWDKHGNKIVEREFLNGKQHGMETAWENGKKLYIHHYRNDKFDGIWIYWDKNGQVSATENWKDGKLHGTRTTYYGNGNKEAEENYKEGKLDGKKTVWYENGGKMIEAFFKDGYRYGIWTTWNEKGAKEDEFNWTTRYEKGERVPEAPVDEGYHDTSKEIEDEMSKYYSNPSTIIEEINKRGAQKIVDDLFNNYESWEYIMNKIASGDDKWLQVALALRPGTDAHATETLFLALGEALVNKPDKVLSLFSDDFSINNICSYPDVNDPRFATKNNNLMKLEKRKKRVALIFDKALRLPQEKCLKALEVSKKEISEWFDEQQ